MSFQPPFGDDIPMTESSGSTSGNPQFLPQAVPGLDRGTLEMMMTVIAEGLKNNNQDSFGQGGFKLKDPEVFNGGQRDVGRFLAALHLKYASERNRYKTEESRVAYAASLLRGPAFSWFQPKLNRKIKDEFGVEINLPPTLGTFAQFETDLRTAFGDPDAAATAARAISSLRQAGNLTKYTAEFRRLQADLAYNDAAYMTLYRNGLSDEIKDELARRDDPLDLQHLIDLSTRIDNRLYARKLEKQSRGSVRTPANVHTEIIPRASVTVETPSSFTAGGMVPMDLSATAVRKRGPLTDVERKHRLDNNLCLYCGQSGHIATDHKGKSKTISIASPKN